MKVTQAGQCKEMDKSDIEMTTLKSADTHSTWDKGAKAVEAAGAAPPPPRPPPPRPPPPRPAPLQPPPPRPTAGPSTSKRPAPPPPPTRPGPSTGKEMDKSDIEMTTLKSADTHSTNSS